MIEVDLSSPNLQVVVGASETGPTLLLVLTAPTSGNPVGNVLILLKFDDPLQAAFVLAEWQRQLAPHIPTDNDEAF